MRRIKWWQQVVTQIILIVIAAYVILPIWGISQVGI